MPSWLDSPALVAGVGALAAIVATALTNRATSRREGQALAHQRKVEADRLNIERGERRFDRRVEATVALVARLRSFLHELEDFRDEEGVAPGHGRPLRLDELYELLTPVVILCPESVARAANDAVSSMTRAVNGETRVTDADAAVNTLIAESRSLLA